MLLAVGQRYADPNRFTIRLKADSPDPPAAYSQRTVCATGLVQSLGGILAMDVEDPSDIVAL
jgi:hypothetical protein